MRAAFPAAMYQKCGAGPSVSNPTGANEGDVVIILKAAVAGKSQYKRWGFFVPSGDFVGDPVSQSFSRVE